MGSLIALSFGCGVKRSRCWLLLNIANVHVSGLSINWRCEKVSTFLLVNAHNLALRFEQFAALTLCGRDALVDKGLVALCDVLGLFLRVLCLLGELHFHFVALLGGLSVHGRLIHMLRSC